METVTISLDLTAINCGKCGGTYAINERYREKKYEDGGFWHCPYCETSWGYVESEKARLQKQVAQLQTTLDHKSAEVNTLRNENSTIERERKRIATKLKRTCVRIQNGVCPCCRRNFQNLARHMHTKHPDYNAVETQ